MKKYIKYLLALSAGLLSAGLLLTGCTSLNNGGESNVMDYNNAILRGVEYSSSSGSMARAVFSVELNEKEIVEARYYPENPEVWDDEISKKEHESISEEDWKAVCEAVELLYPVLKEHTVPNAVNSMLDNIAGAYTLDGGDTFELAFTWEIDGELVRKRYHAPEYERFRVLETLLTELVDPIGREIPVYTPPVLSGVHIVMGNTRGKNRYSFQCSEDKNAPGEYYFFCYYPEDGKDVRYPNEKTDEATWQEIYDKVTELGIEELDTGNTSKGDTITLSYSNGKQRTVKLNKENGEALKNTFLKIMGMEPVQGNKSIWAKIFGK